MDEQERLVLTDPVAIKFLEDDYSVRLVERKRELSGYELYVVEQWTCSRADPTIVITTFTGQTQHKLLASVIEIPSSEKKWSTRLKTYMQFAEKHHARRQETTLGPLMVTNLSTFSSTLTILPVPSGDLRGHRELFFVNENLKRLGCSGRTGITLAQPSDATISKFRQLYKTSEKLSVNESVVELVQLCQIALTMFEKLPQEYCDGLLCDVTSKCLADWWTEIGLQYYNVEPTDGVLGPTTVAALIGLFIGARNRLHAWGAPVSKNAYDIPALKRGIAQFQKARSLPKTRRFDRDTFQRLHKHTAKAATSDGWGVPRAVKSTVAELGKGGEMVMGMVGAKEKGGIADVETTDFDQFLRKLNGERCKWLWRGKTRKTLLRGMAEEQTPAERQGRYDDAGHVWGDSSSNEEDNAKLRQSEDGVYEAPAANQSKSSLISADRDHTGRKTVLKSVTGKMNDAKTGLGRFRDAVGTGLRGHHHKASRDIGAQDQSALHGRRSTELDSPSKATVREHAMKRGHSHESHDGQGNRSSAQLERKRTSGKDVDRSRTHSPALSTAESEGNGELGGRGEPKPGLSHKDKRQIFLPAIRRARSFDPIESPGAEASARSNLHLRHISTMDIPTLSRRLDALAVTEPDEKLTPEAALEAEQYKYVQLEHLHGILIRMQNQFPPLVSQGLEQLHALGSKAEGVRENLETVRKDRTESAQAGAKVAEETVNEGREMLTARLHEIEALGAKLEYELGVLASKIEDVEDGVTDLDRQVVDLESRSRVLSQESQEHSLSNWAQSLARKIGLA